MLEGRGSKARRFILPHGFGPLASAPRRFAVAAGLALVSLAIGAQASLAPAQTPDPRCDASRRAIEYHPGGPVQPGSQLMPCRYDVGAVAMEPSFVFGNDGRILYQTWTTRPGSVGGLPPAPGVRRSDPTYSRWASVTPKGVMAHPTSLDPYIYRDPWTRRVFTVDYLGTGVPLCSEISYTDDEGTHWTTSPLACGGFDGESIGAGPPVSSRTVGYPDIVYYCTGTTLGSSPPTTTPLCSKSIDGGLTFAPTGAAPFPLTGPNDVFAPWAGNPVVGPDGSLYLPKRWNGQPQLAISRNEGRSWSRVQVAGNGASGEATRVAVDPRSGDLFYTWTGADHMPYLSYSINRGGTWSGPVNLAPPGLRETALPRVAVSAAGRVAVVYLGSANAPGHPPYYADCNVFLSACTDGPYAGATWNGFITEIDSPMFPSPLLRTATVNPPSRPLFTGGCSADGACKGELDFLDVHFDASETAWGAFVDDCQLTRHFIPVFNAGAGPCQDGVGEGILGRLVPVPAA
jgi:hypothetical protein